MSRSYRKTWRIAADVEDGRVRDAWWALRWDEPYPYNWPLHRRHNAPAEVPSHWKRHCRRVERTRRAQALRVGDYERASHPRDSNFYYDFW